MFPPFMGWRFPLRGPLDNSLRVLQGWVSRRLKHSTSTAVSQQVTIDQRWKSLLMPNRKGRLGGFCEQEWNHASFAFPKLHILLSRISICLTTLNYFPFEALSEWTKDDLAISDLCNTACIHPPIHHLDHLHTILAHAIDLCFLPILSVSDRSCQAIF